MRSIPLILILILILAFGTCELAAKEYQREHGGYLVFIQPLKENGAFDIGPYNGHWINLVYTKEQGLHFYDVGWNLTFENRTVIKRWYFDNSEVYVLGEDTIPFPMIYHY